MALGISLRPTSKSSAAINMLKARYCNWPPKFATMPTLPLFHNLSHRAPLKTEGRLRTTLRNIENREDSTGPRKRDPRPRMVVCQNAGGAERANEIVRELGKEYPPGLDFTVDGFMLCDEVKPPYGGRGSFFPFVGVPQEDQQGPSFQPSRNTSILPPCSQAFLNLSTPCFGASNFRPSAFSGTPLCATSLFDFRISFFTSDTVPQTHPQPNRSTAPTLLVTFLNHVKLEKEEGGICVTVFERATPIPSSSGIIDEDKQQPLFA
ncbi:uncharacterized protein PAC_07623 [Phialocephala subalpina]|uniref:Uncharacterized protein n=1 Tax=Phialocephala subalpina TaxID=576137 RepID=A0A1L7WY95_9HELO|nr:uncharacterized protein PAC_07623 [Phialocephala subalpina]